MLHEHFRCVEPIIRFSMQFYTEPIIPLRIPKASERLDPPLIDVFVPHGRKGRGQVNMAEVEAIVDEIEKIIDDPSYEGRSIGVVSLIGSKQAHQIQTQLFTRIGEEAYFKHDITCGNPATFQGKERNIMFVSMVECPETQSAKTALLWQQRFNVAFSRARDRMYLFRSVDEDELNPDDLIRHVGIIQHGTAAYDCSMAERASRRKRWARIPVPLPIRRIALVNMTRALSTRSVIDVLRLRNVRFSTTFWKVFRRSPSCRKWVSASSRILSRPSIRLRCVSCRRQFQVFRQSIGVQTSSPLDTGSFCSFSAQFGAPDSATNPATRSIVSI